MAVTATASVNCATVAYARIDDGVEQIRPEIGQAEDSGEHQDRRLHHRQVLAFEREDQHPPKAGIGEDRFNRDDAADQEAKVLRKNRDGRQQRVAERMTQDDDPFRAGSE